MNRNLKEYTKTQMSEKRFNHSLDVSRIASELAKIHHQNSETAETAGLLHDLAREWKFNDATQYLTDRNIPIPNSYLQIPILMHGKVASILIQEKLDIQDQEIVNSIANHTLGRPKMSEIEKIVFIADYLASAIGSDRYDQNFQVAIESLDRALLLIYQNSYDYLNDNRLPIADEFFEAWDYYKSQSETQND